MALDLLGAPEAASLRGPTVTPGPADETVTVTLPTVPFCVRTD